MSTYTTEISSVTNQPWIVRTNDDGSITWVPSDPANADYQAYLNKDTLVSNSSTPQAGN